jgi:transposase
VAVRLPGDGPDGRAAVKRTFKTFYGVLAEAARWLTSLGVTHVAMEATGIYSMPVYHALIEHGSFEKVLVCNAGHVKNVPGRKTDLAGAEWLAHLLECGLLAGSFIPPADIKAARDVIRYRTKIVQSRTSELQRLGGVLQDAGIKIDSVASSIATKSSRAMIEALIDGERRGQVLAELPKGKMRAKIPDLSMALEGRFGEHHALMCRLHLDHIDHLEAMTTALDAQIEAMMTPFRAARDLLTTVPGIGPLAAAAVISEIGADVRGFFPDAAHLASWAGLCPGNHESAGKRRSGKPRHGNQHLQPVLVECAWAAVRHEGYLRSLYHRHVMKWGGYRSPLAKKKAIIVVAYALLVIIWHVLATGKPYDELGADYFTRRQDPERETRRLIARLEALGHQVTLQPAA